MKKAALVLVAIHFLGISASSVEAGEVFGALSISDDGYISWNWNYPSQDEATQKVIKNCQSASPNPDTCRYSVVHNDSWIFAVHCNNDDTQRSFSAWGETAKQAIVKVYQKAVGPDTAYSKENCKIRGFTTGNGSHIKYKEQKEE